MSNIKIYELCADSDLVAEFVKYDDHAAIVAQLEADIADARKPISDEQIENIIYQCDGFLKWGVGDHGKQIIREKIRAIIKEQQ